MNYKSLITFLQSWKARTKCIQEKNLQSEGKRNKTDFTTAGIVYQLRQLAVAVKIQKIRSNDRLVFFCSLLLLMVSLIQLVYLLIHKIYDLYIFFTLITFFLSIITFVLTSKKHIKTNRMVSKHKNGLTSILIKDYKLSKTETGICVEIANGKTKEEIMSQQDIVLRTMSNHLCNIYSKTIEKNKIKSRSNNKFPHLIVFLKELKESHRNEITGQHKDIDN